MKAITLLLAAALYCGNAHAGVPHEINYQGYLANTGGTPVNSAVKMVLTLYDAATDGNVVYTETHDPVAVTNGVFNVLIGSPTPIPGSVLFDMPYWLGIAVGTDAEMTPRQPVAVNGYAIRSATTEALAPGAAVLASQITGTIGTTQLANGAITAAKLASNSCTAGQILKYNGTAWACSADTNSGGTVTSITAGTGLTGGAITTTGTIRLGTVPVANGGTGQTTLAGNGVLYGQGTSGVGVTTAGAVGQVLVGTASAPAWTDSPTVSGTLTAGTLIGIGSGVTNVPGTFRWEVVSGTSVQAVSNLHVHGLWRKLDAAAAGHLGRYSRVPHRPTIHIDRVAAYRWRRISAAQSRGSSCRPLNCV